MARAEFFNTAEIALNDGGQSWGNLGLWRNTTRYSAACRQLAQALGDACRLNPETSVFDAGFGCGDQLLVWIEQFGVQSLRGVNLSQSQTAYARALLRERGHGPHSERLLQGNINEASSWRLAPPGSMSCVLSLDSAYHFPDRRAFFARAALALKPSGRLGLTDFLLGPGAAESAGRRLSLSGMLWCSRIPAHNLVVADEYARQLDSAGFAELQLEDITEQVLPAFADWWQMYGRRQSVSPASRLKYTVTASFLDWAYRKQILRYIIVSAERR